MPVKLGARDARSVIRRANILAALEGKQMSVHDLAIAVHACDETIDNYIGELHGAGLIYIAGWQHTRGRERRLFALGPGVDVPFVKRPFEPKRTRPGNNAAKQQKRILDSLERPMTMHQIALAIGSSYHFVRKHIRVLHKAKKVYISGFPALGVKGALVREYAKGDRPDKDYPRRTDADRYQLMKADRDRYDKFLARKRAKKRIAKALSKPNTIFAALGL